MTNPMSVTELCLRFSVFGVNVLFRTGSIHLPLETQTRDLSVENGLFMNPRGKSKTVFFRTRIRSVSSEIFTFLSARREHLKSLR